MSLHAEAARHCLWVLGYKHTEKYMYSMKGKNLKKEKVSSHLEQSPSHSPTARTITHTWAHRTDKQSPHTLTPHASTALTA